MKGRLAVNDAATWSKKSLVENVLAPPILPAAMKSVRLMSSIAGMVGRKAAGRAFEAAAVQREPPAELPVVAGPPPAVGPLDDRLPDPAQRLGVRPPQAHGQEALARRDVDVEARGVDVAALLVAELDADVRLVRLAALDEPRVAVDPHQRAAHPPVAGHEVRRDPLQPRLEGADEGHRGLQDFALVPPLVLLEPGPVVVVGQLLQELEECRLKARELPRCRLPHESNSNVRLQRGLPQEAFQHLGRGGAVG